MPITQKNRLYETAIMNCGMKATIVNYKAANDIDVLFDDGTIVTNKQYYAFTKGRIANPNYKSANNKGNELLKKPNFRIGEIKKQNCGLTAEIIAYRTANDIDVKFLETGNVLKNKKYQHFRNGNIQDINT